MTADFRRPARLTQVVAEELPNPAGRSLETAEAYESAIEAIELAAGADVEGVEVDRDHLAHLLRTDGADAVVVEILHSQGR